MRYTDDSGAAPRRSALTDRQHRERANYSLRVLARLRALDTSPYRAKYGGNDVCSPLLSFVRGAIAARVRHDAMMTYTDRALSVLGITANEAERSAIARVLDTAIPAHETRLHWRKPYGRKADMTTPDASASAPLASGLLDVYAQAAYSTANTRQFSARLTDIGGKDTFNVQRIGLNDVRRIGAILGISDAVTDDTAFMAHADAVIRQDETQAERSAWLTLTDRNASKRRDASRRAQALRDANKRRDDAMRSATDKLAERFTVKR